MADAKRRAPSSVRPLPSGSLTTDLADLLGTNVCPGNLDLTVNDNSSGAPVAIVPTQTRPLPATAVGTALRDAVRSILASFTQPELRGATVELNGTQLRIVPASTPNASIVLAGAARHRHAIHRRRHQRATVRAGRWSELLRAILVAGSAGVDGTAPLIPTT